MYPIKLKIITKQIEQIKIKQIKEKINFEIK